VQLRTFLIIFNRSVGCDESGTGRSKAGSDTRNRTTACSLKVSNLSHENDGITSSIMSFPQGRNVHRFCDASNHNVQAPTKQNFLCYRKSISEVMYDHSDFRNLPFRYVILVLLYAAQFKGYFITAIKRWLDTLLCNSYIRRNIHHILSFHFQ